MMKIILTIICKPLTTDTDKECLLYISMICDICSSVISFF